MRKTLQTPVMVVDADGHPVFDTTVKLNDPTELQFAAGVESGLNAGQSLTINGELYNARGQCIGNYTAALTYTGNTNADYLANTVKLKDICTFCTDAVSGYVYKLSDVAFIDFPFSRASQVRANRGAVTGQAITTKTLVISDKLVLGGSE